MRLTTYEPVEGGIPYVTVKDEHDALQKLATYEDTGLEPEQIAEYLNATDEYVRASEEGRLIVLPCNVDDTLYYIDGGKSCKAKAIMFKVNQSGLRIYCERHFMGLEGFEGIYGKTVFLTREEAESALKGERTDV